MSLALFFKHWDSETRAVLSMEWPFLNIFARGKKTPFIFIYETTVLLIMIIITADVRILPREGTIFVQ